MSYARAAASFCLLIWVSLAQSLGPSKPITYTTRAAPLASVLRDLSKLAGVPLTCSSELDREPVILRLEGMSAKAVMAKLADLFGGEWMARGKGFELRRGPEAHRRHEAEITRRSDLIRGSLQASLESSQSVNKDNADSIAKSYFEPSHVKEVWSQRRSRTPAGRLLAQILAKLDAREIANLGNNELAVYTDDPQPPQRPLPNLSAELEEYQSSQSFMVKALERLKAADSTKDYPGLMPGWTDKRVGRMLLSVLGSDLGIYSAELTLFDEEGQQLESISSTFGRKYDWLQQRAAELGLRKKMDEPIVLGSLVKDVTDPILPGYVKGSPIRSEAQALILNPTETDPLALATSEVLLGFAERDQVNLAAYPTDYCEAWSRIAGRTGRLTWDLFEKVLGRGEDMQFEEDEQWLTGKPTDPIAASETRLSREALGPYLQAAAEDDRVSIASEAAFDAAIDPEMNTILAQYGLLDLIGVQSEWATSTAARSALRFYGSLTDIQATVAKHGHLELGLRELNGTQMTALLEWLWTFNGALSFARPPDPNERPHPLQLGQWSTEIAAKGFPAGSRITVTDRWEPFYFLPPPDPEDNPDLVSYDLGGLARQVAESEKPENPGEKRPDLSKIRMGSKRTLEMTLAVGTDYALEQDFAEFPKSKETFTLKEVLERLSAADREKFVRALDQARKGNELSLKQ